MSVSLSTKGCRWLNYCLKQPLVELCRVIQRKLLAAFEAEEQEERRQIFLCPLTQPLIEPLSQRELEVLQPDCPRTLES